MRAGALRHPVIIEEETTVADDALVGEVQPAWTSFSSWRCAIEPLRGQELVVLTQRYGTVSHRLRGRYVPGLVPAMRITLGSRVFRIEAVLDVDERRRELEVLATEVLPGS